ncbi:MAG: carboxy-S-adenosyl-L-methionine synthase CmoA [Acidiferrobacterales bacterium]
MKKDQHTTDRVYTEKLSSIDDFEFDDAVAGVFPDMLKRSIPGYSALINLIGTSSRVIVRPGTYVYDLGCSLGAVSAAVRNNCAEINYHGLAVDNSEAMIKRCRALLDRENSEPKIEVVCDDIRDVEIQNASLVVLNFTLQFIPIDDRAALLKKIANGLNPGGFFILSEKIISDSAEEQEAIDLLYENFKRVNGYSELEISQKREALENVLIPETFTTHKNRLEACGFKNVQKWFQVLNFISIIAQK